MRLRKFRPLRRLRLLTTRIVISNILVAALTSVSAVLVLLLILAVWISGISAADYRSYAMLAGMEWLFEGPDGSPNIPGIYSEGFSLVVGPDDVVLYSQGDTDCRAGMLLAECAPELLNLDVGERFFERRGERWAEIVIETITGQRVISHRGPQPTELTLMLPGTPIYGTVPFIVVVVSAMAILSVPVALLLTWLFVRPTMRRLSNVTQASRRFSDGDLKVRIMDHNPDEVGELAQQFNDMAAALEQNFSMLRELAQQNAELARKAEESAIQAERIRISRDLHDAIAQRLFSLSVSASTLPDLIRRDQEKGAQQASAIAALAEETLIDLRALLIDLRPTSVIQRGLGDALQALCDEWGKAHRAAIHCSVILSGKYIPASVEDAVYRVAQEALSNVVRHSGASVVDVSLVQGQRQITLSVTDNGRGFDPATASADGKFGLVSMRERARSVGGTLVIESDPTRGTTVQLVLPLKKDTIHEH